MVLWSSCSPAPLPSIHICSTVICISAELGTRNVFPRVSDNKPYFQNTSNGTAPFFSDFRLRHMGRVMKHFIIGDIMKKYGEKHEHVHVHCMYTSMYCTIQ